MISRLLPAVALVVATTGAVVLNAAPGAIRPGLYGDVRMSKESGDLGGLEVEVGPSNMVEVVYCEGWCNKSYHTRYSSKDGTIRFAIPDEIREPSGRIVVQPIPVELRLSGRNVLARVAGDDTWRRLKPLRRPFALDIARHEGRQ